MNAKAIDLFCGCGGLSAGLQRAGFEIIAGVDLEPRYISTFGHNFGSKRARQIDLSELSPVEFMKLVGVKRGELDLLAGGPPCQGFSKNVPRRSRTLGSENNRLVSTFLDYCSVIQPRMILMENVAEMKNGFDQAYSNEIMVRLGKLGYQVSTAVLNAADYGVPQRRRRAFFIAGRDGVSVELPPPTHIAPLTGPLLLKLPTHVTVWDAIGDLPSLRHGEGEEIVAYPSAVLSDYQKMIRKGAKMLSCHVARLLQPMQLKRLSSLKPGEGLKDLPIKIRPKSGYSGAYGRLTKDMVAPTITRWVFHPGSGRWGHPIDDRVLTIREAARIQGFPDSFGFVGSYIQRAGQIGNAVPPLLAEAIGRTLLARL
jgi:DNA (cytosine-5)-methyltransferase 1